MLCQKDVLSFFFAVSEVDRPTVYVDKVHVLLPYICVACV